MMSDPDVFYAPPPASPFDFEEEQKRLNLKKIVFVFASLNIET